MENQIQFTNEQYQTLVAAVEAGSAVYGILGDYVSEEYKKQSDAIEQLRAKLLGLAPQFKADAMTEQYMGHTILSDSYENNFQEVMNQYNDENFWHELETRLGKRDFERTKTKADKIAMKKNGGWYPERIHKIYGDWSREFEKHGIARLVIIDDE